MENVLNVLKFKEFLKKATLNDSIDRVQLNFAKGKVKVSMKSQANDVIINLNVDNDFLTLSEQDEIKFNLVEPRAYLLPPLDIIDSEDVPIKIHEDEKILIGKGKQVSCIHLKDDAAVKKFLMTKNPKDDLEYFTSLDINDDFTAIFDKIKRIGNRFGKIYINVNNKNLGIETTDKTHNLSDGTNFILNTVNMHDLTMCFDFKNFVNMMNVIDLESKKENGKKFKLKIVYIKEADGGLIHAESTDGSENYMLLNREL